ncbi:hypothetical protein GCK72_001312 [Caenorhabditis remanei]|uniref:Uncharacterized protein n=1 Tax=Caenorhabditis remanei TaxID=31234 RepID=A0A6A5HPD5_CAERE|nr:hypothetical protein GCK72_001312 [Caenorhabditis remanei]KAF1769495.1 hypothetical protein GCK72_001312 [Caenorhabditis remanei]
MIPTSRRQRYFRPNSPPVSPSSPGAGPSHRSMNSSNLNVLEQAELVIDGGDEQQVSHEEIVDDGSSDMVVDHHHHHQQHQLRNNPMHHHYDNRQQSGATLYQVQQQNQQQSQSIRRAIGRPIVQRPPNYVQTPMDMVQKLQNKNVYMPQQRPQTRISPAGARIVSFAGRKRDNPDALPPGVKKMTMASTRPHSQPQHQTQAQQQVPQQVQQAQKNLQAVKVVRLAPSSTRANPTASEHALIEIENNIKQTIEDSKIDVDKLRELQEAEFSQDEYHQYLGMLLIDLERSNEANLTLTNYYRDRQRHEKTIFEARENAFAARIRQLETENRKLRESIHTMYCTKFNEAGGHNNLYRNDHMGQMMVEEPEEHVVIEGHVGNNQESEEVPQEWIVEETVEEHRMHLQELESDDHQHLVDDQQQDVDQDNDVKDKDLLVGNSRFGPGSSGGQN